MPIGASEQEFLSSRRLVEPGSSVAISITVARCDITKFETGERYDIGVWLD